MRQVEIMCYVRTDVEVQRCANYAVMKYFFKKAKQVTKYIFISKLGLEIFLNNLNKWC